MNIEVVVGANYGDEGKGLATDYICSHHSSSIVVMTNGGSQRGHTVELKNNLKHVFHHFGSGTLRGAATYFPSTFLLNPMQYAKEYGEILQKTKLAPMSFRDPNCILQLPCDIALNWHIERSRGELKHGSVGCGIWESKYRIYANDACTLDEFCSMEFKQQIEYIKKKAKKFRDIRCAEEHVSNDVDLYDLFINDSFLQHFISDCIFMRDTCKVAKLKDLSNFNTVVFENGQGLKLDQLYNKHDEANTTPSFTGTISVAKILNESSIDINSLTINYISRTYLTKHGAGKFNEHDNAEEMTFLDETNIQNEWQDNLRFAKLNYNEMVERCNKDANMLEKILLSKTNISKKIFLTHANEIPVENIDIMKDYSINISNSKFSDDIVCI